MTTQELIVQLQRHPPDTEVYTHVREILGKAGSFFATRDSTFSLHPYKDTDGKWKFEIRVDIQDTSY